MSVELSSNVSGPTIILRSSRGALRSRGDLATPLRARIYLRSGEFGQQENLAQNGLLASGQGWLNCKPPRSGAVATEAGKLSLHVSPYRSPGGPRGPHTHFW